MNQRTGDLEAASRPSRRELEAASCDGSEKGPHEVSQLNACLSHPRIHLPICGLLLVCSHATLPVCHAAPLPLDLFFWSRRFLVPSGTAKGKTPDVGVFRQWRGAGGCEVRGSGRARGRVWGDWHLSVRGTGSRFARVLSPGPPLTLHAGNGPVCAAAPFVAAPDMQGPGH